MHAGRPDSHTSLAPYSGMYRLHTTPRLDNGALRPRFWKPSSVADANPCSSLFGYRPCTMEHPTLTRQYLDDKPAGTMPIPTCTRSDVQAPIYFNFPVLCVPARTTFWDQTTLAHVDYSLPSIAVAPGRNSLFFKLPLYYLVGPVP